jgi:dCTP deaminase
LVDLLTGETLENLVCQGPTVDLALTWFGDDVRDLLREAGLSVSYYVRSRMLPLPVLRRLHGRLPELGRLDRFRYRGSGRSLPAILRINGELAWLLGLYIAEGYVRDKQIIIANTDQRILDRAEAALAALGQIAYRSSGAITCCSKLVSALFRGFSMGTSAASKRLPKGALGWPWRLLDALLEGLIDADGSVRPERECLWTTSDRLVSDVLLLCARLGKRAVTQVRAPRPRSLPLHVVSIATNRHKVLTSVPNPSQLLVDVRTQLGLTQVRASQQCGYTHPTSMNGVENDRKRSSVHIATLERIHDSYSRLVPSVLNPIGKLTRLVNSDTQWDKVAEVVDTGRFEVVYDLEVRSPTAKVQNFLGGRGGVFLANTAGFIDPSFEGHVTLEISNLANLPVALYPGMRIGQLSFSLMTTPAERPYGPGRGSKYSGQDVPTASRLYLDFQP